MSIMHMLKTAEKSDMSEDYTQTSIKTMSSEMTTTSLARLHSWTVNTISPS